LLSVVVGNVLRVS